MKLYNYTSGSSEYAGGLKYCRSSEEGVIEGAAVAAESWVGPTFDGNSFLDGVGFRHVPKLGQDLATADFHGHVLGDTVVLCHAGGNQVIRSPYFFADVLGGCSIKSVFV